MNSNGLKWIEMVSVRIACEVRKELLAYLYARKVRPPKRVKKEIREDDATDVFSDSQVVHPEPEHPGAKMFFPQRSLQGRAKRPRTKSSSRA